MLCLGYFLILIVHSENFHQVCFTVLQTFLHTVITWTVLYILLIYATTQALDQRIPGANMPDAIRKEMSAVWPQDFPQSVTAAHQSVKTVSNTHAHIPASRFLGKKKKKKKLHIGYQDTRHFLRERVENKTHLEQHEKKKREWAQ